MGLDRVDVDRLAVGVQEQVRPDGGAVVAETSRLGRHVDALEDQVGLGHVPVAGVRALVPQPRQLVLEVVLVLELVQQLALGVRVVGELLQRERLVQGESAGVERALRGGRQRAGLDRGADPADVDAAGIGDLLVAETEVEQHLVGLSLLDALQVLVVVVELQELQDELDVVVGVGDEARQVEAFGSDRRLAAPLSLHDSEVLDGLSVLDRLSVDVDGREEPDRADDQRGADAEQPHGGDQVVQVTHLRALEALRLVHVASVEQPGAERQLLAVLAGVEVHRPVDDLADQRGRSRDQLGAGDGAGFIGRGDVVVRSSLGGGGVVDDGGHDGITSTYRAVMSCARAGACPSGAGLIRPRPADRREPARAHPGGHIGGVMAGRCGLAGRGAGGQDQWPAPPAPDPVPS